MKETKKRYLITILLKKIGIENIIKRNINFSFDMMKQTYPSLSDIEIEEIKNKFNYDNYANRIIPIYEENFSIEEITKLLEFYVSDLGQKIVSGDFLIDVEKEGNKMINSMEQDFARKYYEKKNGRSN